MKKIFFLIIATSLLVSACGNAAATKQAAPTAGAAAINPSPVSAVDLNATAAVMVQQTIQAMPTQTPLPSATPVVVTETPTGTATPVASPTMSVTETASPNPLLLTLTATLGTGTPSTVIPFSTPEQQQPAITAESAPTGTEYPRTYGTLPPSLPSGKIYLINKSNRDATISMRCTNKDGSVTIIEYPVQGTIKTIGPTGKYTFVSWVGGKKFTGSFRLDVGKTISLIFYKDNIDVKASKE